VYLSWKVWTFLRLTLIECFGIDNFWAFCTGQTYLTFVQYGKCNILGDIYYFRSCLSFFWFHKIVSNRKFNFSFTILFRV
jgi:hypothetical protein